jgi:TetR/AcrR family transcriptional regulator, transcriptional repressor for nem operon
MARPREFDHEVALDRAMAAFWAKGYDATSIEDLVARMGIQRGSLYGAFGDKHSMFMLGLNKYCNSVTQGFRADLHDSALPAYDRLVTHLRNRAGSTAADTKRRGCLMAKGAAELAATDADVSKLVKRTLEAWLGELAATIAAAQGDGDLAPEADPRQLASLLLAVVRGIEALRTAGMSSATTTAAVEQAIALLPKKT